MSEQHDNWLVTLGMPTESFDSRPEQGGDDSGTGADEGGENTNRRGAGQESSGDSQNPQQESGDGGQNTQQDQREDDGSADPTGPTVSAQSADVEDALKAKQLWEDTGSRYGKLLNDANVPNGVSVTTTITVDSALNVHIKVTTSPTDPSGAALERLLNSKCDGPFKAAITEWFNRKGLKVTDTLTVKWLNW